MFVQLATYWLIIQLIGLAALPTTLWLLRGLPDRGYAFAKPLGLLVVGWAAWFVAMLGLAPFGVPLLLVLLLALALGTWPALLRTDLRAALQRWWPTILGYELLFLAAFVFAAIMRAYQPDPWGTERAMDFAFFNAIRRGGTFPPQDPWLAGYSINYYYLGYLLMAAVSLLSGLGPAVTYNLSLALLFAMTATGVAGLVLNLIGLTVPSIPRSEPRSLAPIRWLFALLSVICVLVVGNLTAPLMLLTGSAQVVALDGRQLLSAVGQGLAGSPTITLPYATPPVADFNAPTGLLYWERVAVPQGFSDWWPSRSLWDDLTDENGAVTRRYAITEFPFFSFWLGDMHPHVMSLPFCLLAIAVALSTAARATSSTYAHGRAGWAELLLAGMVLGGLYMINSWDLPTYFLVFGGALLLQHARLGGQAIRWRHWFGQLLLVGSAALALYLPFHLTFRSLVGSKEPLVDLPLLGRLTSTIGFFTADKTDLHYFLVIFGLFLVPLLAFVWSQRQPAELTLGIAASTRQRWDIGLASIVAAFALGLVVGFPLLALLPLGLYAAYTALRVNVESPNIQHSTFNTQHSAGVGFALWLVAIGCFVCFGTELIYIRDTFEGWQPRFNTIFKFYYQTWLIWGALSGYALWWLLRSGGRAVSFVIGALMLLLLLGGLVYPALTAGRMASQKEWRGLAGITPRESSPEGRAAIEWLRANAATNAVVLEGVGGSYNPEGYGGVSASTGLPTVLGWPGHQEQWRGGDPAVLAQIRPREADVSLIYSTTDPAQARELLALYNVAYVYWSDLERQAYGVEGEAKFAALGDVVFQEGNVTIYRVR